MKFFVTLKRRHLAVILAIIIIGLLIFGQLLSAKASGIDGSTNATRVEYIKSIGIAPDDTDVSSKEIVIPQNFSNVYKEYNRLQKKAGFDLSRYRGEKATVYTYGVSGSDRELHLIVCKDKIIGGDIADINVNGEMLPLKRTS